MNKNRPYCLSIAGFDPSGGAGILADIKAFEGNKVNGMAVVTGLTFQNDSEFEAVEWIELGEIIRQTEILLRKFQFDCVKIGMIKDLTTLKEIISYLTSHLPHLRIIWDPIVKTSSGFEIQKNLSPEAVKEVCKKIFLITPNVDEIRILMNDRDDMRGAKELSRHCHVFLKGGHRTDTDASRNLLGKDFLFTTDEKIYPFRAKKISSFPKHGSGCVLSSAMAANLARQETLLRACLKAKNYVTEFLMSNKTPLGYHKI
jgi:hydroxymethylpyrimidine/phosphomethylpyrimidine kinase